mmetsp:Transcript_107982/g.168823  ORF Transcript_107982/g.168823 Transcript_107982/m.168823 type:complete len:363 (+) Transcript_107982:136-1224(+)
MRSTKDQAGKASAKNKAGKSQKHATSGASSKTDIQKDVGKNMLVAKAGLLVVLSVQHCMVGLITHQSQATSSGRFLPQTGVICQEILKGCVSLILLTVGGESLLNVFSRPMELARASVPALLYLVQNNLQYISLRYLDPATYIVTYQLKILSTALMSVLLLHRTLDLSRWMALVLLVCGVSIVQLSEKSGSAPSPEDVKEGALSEQLIGLIAVLSSCVISGLAGVYTEMILKTSSVSLWARNVQLAIFSIFIGIGGLAGTGDLEKITSHGFFQGYNGWVCASIVNNSFGGLLIAVIIKYADNIIKNFATAFSIVLTTAGSMYAMGLSFSATFFLGCAIVCSATFLYGGLFDTILRSMKGKRA